MKVVLLTLPLTSEHDLVSARQRARDISAWLGFGTSDQIRIAAVVSEIARNALVHGGSGRIEFEARVPPSSPVAELGITVDDAGPGMSHPVSGPGGGLGKPDQGLAAAMRLMDGCAVRTAPGQGTSVALTKTLPADVPLPDLSSAVALAGQLEPLGPACSVQELQRQNRELVSTLAALRERQDELVRLTHELEDTNRGVVALYAELDEQAERLRHADDMKSRFLSNMSHEFRTPLSSMRALTRLLLTQVDGALTEEQVRQVGFIDTAARELSDLVNDLLDLAKIEAGMVTVRCEPFEVSELFSALRGMFKPLLANDHVQLVFEQSPAVTTVVGDESKISQILRNFISNAIKFTVKGEIRVSCNACSQRPGYFELLVRDTGIGVASSQVHMIFEEFTQVENELQQAHKGTGLGLPLCKRLATLLGGFIDVSSTVGIGSCFRVTLPLQPTANATGNDLRHMAMAAPP